MAGVPVINQSPITFFLSLLFLAASLFCASRRSVCQNPMVSVQENETDAGLSMRCIYDYESRNSDEAGEKSTHSGLV